MKIIHSSEINNTFMTYTKEKTLNVFFEDTVGKQPYNIAVTTSQMSMTYSELNSRANQLARTLIKNGIYSGDVVAIQFERSIEMLIAILAIIKIGAAYLPLDIDIPADRLIKILDDSKTRILLKQRNNTSNITLPLDVLYYEELPLDADNSNLNIKFSSANIAYVMYTSGSTGTPKGVMVRHYSVVNHILWRVHQFLLTKTDIFLQKTPYIFDISVWEIFLCFFIGAKLHLCQHAQERNVDYLVSEIEKNNITACQFVPSLLLSILKFVQHRNCAHRLKSLKKVFSGGEILHYTTVNLFYELLSPHNNDVRLYNLYGPTEATIDATFFDCSQLKNCKTSSVPIGRPIWNTKIYIADIENDEFILCNDGEIGEICIAGDGVALGYINNEELTKSAFIPDPWEKGGFIYRTGDIGKWNNGQIEFLGRKDLQIKVRGMRIELEEIESVINQMDGIIQSIVIACDVNESDKILQAFYLSNIDIDENQIRSFLRTKLPDYMIPVKFVRVKEFPYTSSNKIDRKRVFSECQLYDVISKISPNIKILNTLNETTEKILSVIKKNLDISLPIDDNFLDTELTILGVDSFSYIRLVIALEQEFNFEFDDEMLLIDIFPNIRAIIDYIITKINES